MPPRRYICTINYTKVTGGHNRKEYVYPLSLLDFWLVAFITEVRKADGGFYYPTSLNSILAGIFRYMKEKFSPNTLTKTDARFSAFKMHSTDS